MQPGTTPPFTVPAAAPASWRARLAAWVEGPRVQRFIITLIVINAVTLGLETSAQVMARAGPLLRGLDAAILAVFVVEILLRIAARGPAFFRDPWSVFDFVVVGIALVPASGPFSVLRALRVLRVLRLLSVVPSMRRVVGALLTAIPGIGSIALIIGLIFYVFAVIATNLFGGAFPDWFGTVGHSMYTLFQIMTLESWSMGIVRPVMETHPYAWAFFIPFILVATFTILNLFIAIIVNTMQTMHHVTHTREQAAIEDAVHHEGVNLGEQIKALRQELSDIKRLLGQRGDD